MVSKSSLLNSIQMTAIAAKYSKSKRRHTFGGTSSIQTPLKELLGDKKSVKKRKQQRMEALEVQHKVKVGYKLFEYTVRMCDSILK